MRKSYVIAGVILWFIFFLISILFAEYSLARNLTNIEWYLFSISYAVLAF